MPHQVQHLCTQLPVAMVTEVSGASPLQSRARCINSALRMLIPRVRMLIPRVRRKDTAGATCRLVKLDLSTKEEVSLYPIPLCLRQWALPVTLPETLGSRPKFLFLGKMTSVFIES